MQKKRLAGVILPVLIILILFYLFFPRHSFGDFTMGIFRRELSANTLNLHYTLTEPESFGMEEPPVSLGSFSKDSLKDELQYLKDCQKKLEKYEKDSLSENDKLTAELLDWWLEGQLLVEDYYYYQEPLGPTLGIQAQLHVVLEYFGLG